MGSEIEHDCRDSAVEDFESREHVCLRCGKVVTEDPTWAEVILSHRDSRESSGDHNAGNALYLSLTPQQDYISEASPGVAFQLNSSAKDAFGKRVKKQLQDPYTTGNICGKGMVVREDVLTGERKLAFSMYETPIIHLVKKKATEQVSRWRLDTVGQCIVANEIKKICSRLIMGPIIDFSWQAAVLNSGLLDEKATKELEKELLASIDKIRLKLISRCDLAQAKAIIQKEQQPNPEPKVVSPISAR